MWHVGEVDEPGFMPMQRPSLVCRVRCGTVFVHTAPSATCPHRKHTPARPLLEFIRPPIHTLRVASAPSSSASLALASATTSGGKLADSATWVRTNIYEYTREVWTCDRRVPAGAPRARSGGLRHLGVNAGCVMAGCVRAGRLHAWRHHMGRSVGRPPRAHTAPLPSATAPPPHASQRPRRRTWMLKDWSHGDG